LALRSGNPKALNVAMAKMLGAKEFCTQSHTFKVRKCLALRNAKRIYPSDLNTNHTGLTE
jgi:hypothetical protein